MRTDRGGAMVDTKGVGHPFVLKGTAEQEFGEWTHRVHTSMLASFRDQILTALTWAARQRMSAVVGKSPPVWHDSSRVIGSTNDAAKDEAQATLNIRVQRRAHASARWAKKRWASRAFACASCQTNCTASSLHLPPPREDNVWTPPTLGTWFPCRSWLGPTLPRRCQWRVVLVLLNSPTRSAMRCRQQVGSHRSTASLGLRPRCGAYRRGGNAL